MTGFSPHSHWSRRQFLKALGLGVLSSPLLSPWEALAAPAARRPAALPLKLGLLVPESRACPALRSRLLAGLRQELGVADWATAQTGCGSAAALAAAESLLGEGIDGLVAMLSPSAADRLGTSLSREGIPLVICSAGENLAQRAAGTEVQHSSLGYWQASWALGAWAARRLGRRAWVASSFYDSGYDALCAFQAGLESAGGEVVATRVTHRFATTDDLRGLWAEIRQARPDFVYGAYCGPWAVDFVRAYAAAGLAREIPLTGGAFMVDETLLPVLGRAALGVVSGLAGESDSLGALAALGREAGRALAGQASRPPSVVCIRRVEAWGGCLANVAIDQVALPADLEARFAAACPGPRSGWLNAYLT